jgi:DNA-directed RNA polymerase specialized sigma54-like protein
MSEPDPEAADETPQEVESPDAPTESEKELVVDEKDNAEDFERLTQLDRGRSGLLRRDASSFRESDGRGVGSQARRDGQHRVARESLQDYLTTSWRVGSRAGTAGDRRADHLLPRSARDGGYFRTGLEDLLPADATPEFGIWPIRPGGRPVAGPAGVAARDLRECLLRQLHPEMPFYEVAKDADLRATWRTCETIACR